MFRDLASTRRARIRAGRFAAQFMLFAALFVGARPSRACGGCDPHAYMTYDAKGKGTYLVANSSLWYWSGDPNSSQMNRVLNLRGVVGAAFDGKGRGFVACACSKGDSLVASRSPAHNRVVPNRADSELKRRASGSWRRQSYPS